MYKLTKYFEEIVNPSQVIKSIKHAIEELKINMIDYEGVCIVETLIGSGAGQYAGKEFLELIRVPQKEIQDAKENGYLEDLTMSYFGTLAEDLATMCEEKEFELKNHTLCVKYNENDGAIELCVTYDYYEDISSLDQDEYNLRLSIANHFECDITEVIDIDEDGLYQVEGIEYLILDDDDADEKCKENIEEIIWAFNPSFLAECTDLPVEMFQAVVDNGKCESNNDALYMVVDKLCGIDEFVESAINADGRGHFLSYYDGEEVEFDVQGETYYAYRQ